MNEVKRILAPTDFCRCGEAALEHACWLAEQFGAELHLLHVVPARSGLTWGRVEEGDRVQQARRRLDSLPDPDVQRNLEIRRDVRQGAPAKEITQYAKEHDIHLIVMSAAARRERDQSLDVKQMEKVARAAPCPVMAVPELGSVITRSLVEQGARVLQRHFGSEVRGEHLQTRTSLIAELVESLHIDERFAQGLCGELEHRHVLVWSEPSPSTNGDEELLPATPTGSWRIYPEALRLDDEEEADERLITFHAENEAAGETAPALNLLRRAVAARATDVHIDPYGQGEMRVRFRIDGQMEEFCRLHPHVGVPLIQQILIMAELNIADRFQPREGRLRLPRAFASWQVRVTTAPVPEGEAVALRLLSRDRLLRPLSDWGLSTDSFSAVYRMLHQQAGLVLATGPAGAGKTTTVYSMLNLLISEQRNVVSIEDPVELTVPFMRQINVEERHGVTMSSGLSTILRMDPDVIFVGEIRDAATARTAIQAANSGKFVFSTLHTRNVAATVTALRDLGIDNSSLGGNLTGVISQRLVRKLCVHCRVKSPINVHERAAFEQEGLEPPEELPRPRKCPHCRNTGYHERTGVFEAVLIDRSVAEAVNHGASEHEIHEMLRERGTPTIFGDALFKTLEGITSLEEAQRVCRIGETPPVLK